MLHSTEVLCSISNNDYLNLNIHRHYTHRTQEDNDKAIKILLDKINDPEKINWHPRFHKTLAECDITLPLVDLVDFRSVLMNTFQSAHTDIANLKSSLRLIISGSPHSRSTDIRLARTYLRTASTLQCSQTLDPFTVMHTYTDLCLAHPLET